MIISVSLSIQLNQLEIPTKVQLMRADKNCTGMISDYQCELDQFKIRLR